MSRQVVGWFCTACRYAAQALEHQLDGIALAQVTERGLGDLDERSVGLALDDFLEQGLEIPEVLVDDGAGNPGSASNGFDRRPVEAGLGDQRGSDVQELVAARLSAHASRGAGVRMPSSRVCYS